MRFIGCDSIQSRSLVSDRFETKTMTRLELKRIGQINRMSKASLMSLNSAKRALPAESNLKVISKERFTHKGLMVLLYKNYPKGLVKQADYLAKDLRFSAFV